MVVRMVKTGHGAVRVAKAVPVEFQSPGRPALQVETFSLSSLARRMSSHQRFALQRLHFHLWVVFTRGSCRHMVDFDHYPCKPGTVLHVRPGQVHFWDLRRGLEGRVLLLTQALMPPALSRQPAPLSQRFIDDDGWPATVVLPVAHRARVTRWLEMLETTARASDDSPASTELLRHLVSVALLDVFRSCQAAPRIAVGVEPERLRQFKLAVERSFRVTRLVGDYAAALGCAPKTLDRACRAATGLSAKAFIDARVILEAKRHLAHTDETIEHIGAELGFTESTNFVKFYKARTRVAPGAFRASARGRFGPRVA